ncbi:MAG TPA: exo-alpha-sialidase [Nitrolancea sp.]|nr:exo-alpha-sialidase [Nitrolancea sp.]
MARLRATLCLVLLLGLLVACGGGKSTPLPPVTVVSGGSSVSPSSIATASASPATVASPIPGSGYLEIDQAPVLGLNVIDPNRGAAYARTGDSLYRSDEQGRWTKIGPWDPAWSLLVDPTNPDVLYSGGHPGCAIGGDAVAFQKSTDGGVTWQTMLSGQNVRPLIVDPTNPKVIFGERCTLSISVDGGKDWTDVPLTPNFDVSAMSLAGNELYLVVTSEGGTSRVAAVNVADPSHPQLGNDLLKFWGGGIVAASADRIIVGEPHGVDRSDDGGAHWSFSRSGLEPVTVSVNALVEPIPNSELSGQFGIYSLAIDPTNSERIFAGTIRGLYLSLDNGTTWARVSSIAAVPVRSMAFAQQGALLYVTTDNGVVGLAHP